MWRRATVSMLAALAAAPGTVALAEGFPRGAHLSAGFDRTTPERSLETAGRSTMHLARTGRESVQHPWITDPAWSVVSDQLDCELGTWASTAGDVNGDGYSDLIVGAPYYDAGEVDEGRVFVYHGAPEGCSTTPSLVLETNRPGDFFGYRVATAGDVNGDGYADILVGITGYSGDVSLEGRVELYLGSKEGLVPSPAWSFDGNQSGSLLGEGVSTAGDVNGDGYDDVVIGGSAHGIGGTAFFFFGDASGLQAEPSWTVTSPQAAAMYGREVATAGDVNADGFDDVIVGAPRYDAGQLDEGLAFVYLGGPEGLATTPAWTWEANQSGAHGGGAVSTAGDTNGDGYADVIVGAAKYDLQQQNEGRSFVFLGSPAGVDAEPAWSAGPDNFDARYGTSVATAGDVNGDGFADVLVGAFSYTSGENDEGAAFLYLGSWNGLETVPALLAESGMVRAGLGVSVMPAGDVNGDGFSDIIFGAPAYERHGAAFLYHGMGASISPTAAVSENGPSPGSRYGQVVASAGDLNGDGHDDFVVAAPFHSNGEPAEGAVIVFQSTPDDSLARTVLESDHEGAEFGASVACAGDVNGDGYDDLIVGAPGFTNGEAAEGRALLFFGSSSGLDSTAAWTAEGDQAGARLGCSVAGAGDVNGDGYADVILGAEGHSNGEDREGRAILYLGSSVGLLAVTDWTAESDRVDAEFGSSVACAGDVNGDGLFDVVVGARHFSNGEEAEGASFVYLGSPAGLEPLPAWRAEGNEAGASFGASVAGAGDVNGDGYSDMLVGAEGVDGFLPDDGRVFLYHGSSSGIELFPAWTAAPDSAGADTVGSHFGRSVASAGDVNGDGYSDVLIGAPSANRGQTREGVALVYLGSPQGLEALPATALEQDVEGALVGFSVATAGDVNGDGFSDVLAGAPELGEIGTAAGAWFLHLGNKDVPGSTTLALGAGLDRATRQIAAGAEAPIALNGKSDAPDAFRLRAVARTAAGRGKVLLEWETKPHDVPFTRAGLGRGAVSADTGPPQGAAGSFVVLAESVNGLASGTAHRWRARLLSDSPYFPRTPWISMARNAISEIDFRTPAAVVGVAGPSAPAIALLETIHPQPFRAGREISYSMQVPGAVALTLYDALGRERVVLDAGERQPGSYSIRWDGRDRRGTMLPRGVYFVRLAAGSRHESKKLVWAP